MKCLLVIISFEQGLPKWGKSTGTNTKVTSGIYPLGVDEFGYTCSWMKRINPRTGSGLISCRWWAWNVGMNQQGIDIIYHLDVYLLN